MAKQHLKLAKEIQCRDLDALIAKDTMVLMRYCSLHINAVWRQIIEPLATCFTHDAMRWWMPPFWKRYAAFYRWRPIG